MMRRSLARGNVSLAAALFDAIDAAAKERGLSRSAFLASAAREKIIAGHTGFPEAAHARGSG